MTTIIAPVMLLMVMQICQAAVQVQVGDIAVPLESVKKLKELLGTDAKSAQPHKRSQQPSLTVCANPELPGEFKYICEREDAPLILKRFDLAVRDDDLCELCVNVACTGC